MPSKNASTKPRLFMPGPVNTSSVVKEALLRDVPPEAPAFQYAIRDVRRKLTDIAQVDPTEYATVLIAGHGALGVESVIGSTVPRGHKLLVPLNGDHGRQAALIGDALGIDVVRIEFPEHEPLDAEEIAEALEKDRSITHVYAAQCEPASGILNPVGEIGEIVHEEGRSLLVDAIASFGAVPLDLDMAHVDYLVSAADRCLEGAPGIAFVIAKRESLQEAEGNARSLALDLVAQYRHFEDYGRFRATPPTPIVAALHAALDELDEEGGVEGRGKRYAENYKVLIQGMIELGFVPFLLPEYQSYVVTAFLYPEHPNFSFDKLNEELMNEEMFIARGTLASAKTFRIGCVGQIFSSDMEELVATIRRILQKMDVSPALRQA